MKVDHDVLAICLRKLGLIEGSSVTIRVATDTMFDEFYEIKRVKEK